MSTFTAQIVGSLRAKQTKKSKKNRDDDDHDDEKKYHHRNMLDLIFVKVESSMQLLNEIYGYLFEHDHSIYAEICTFLELMEENGPSLLSLYSHSGLKKE